MGGWHQGQRFPHDVQEDLKAQGFDTHTHEGIEYWMVPDESSNTPGTMSHYAQRTGPQDLKNPPGFGGAIAYNRSAETFRQTGDYTAHTSAPDAVKRYVKETPSYDEARKGQSEYNERVLRQINPEVPADTRSNETAPPTSKKK